MFTAIAEQYHQVKITADINNNLLLIIVVLTKLN